MGKKILIVDDEPDLLKLACFRLEKSGYQVLTAVNGQEALAIAGKEYPDLILLDFRLPLLDGSEVCARLKADDKLKNIPIIIFTASIENMDDKIIDCGAQDYIIKPFTPEELLGKIKKWIA